MKTNRFWAALAVVALIAIIVGQLTFIVFAMVKLVPSWVKAADDGMFYVSQPDTEAILARAQACLIATIHVANHVATYWWLWAALLIVLVARFEWGVHGQNKPWIRVAALAVAALGTTVFATVVGVSLLLPYVVAAPGVYGRPPEVRVREETAALDEAIDRLEAAYEQPDWAASSEHALEALSAANALSGMGATASTLLTLDDQPRVEATRAKLDAVSKQLQDVYEAVTRQDNAMLESALARFHEVYGQLFQRSQPRDPQPELPATEPAAADIEPAKAEPQELPPA